MKKKKMIKLAVIYAAAAALVASLVSDKKSGK